MMKVVLFIEPPQADVIEEILRHCGLWQSSAARAPPDVEEAASQVGFRFFSSVRAFRRYVKEEVLAESELETVEQ